MSNVVTWRTALDNGFEPRHYPYAGEDVPIGEYEARLDLKVWSKNTMGISCYFTRASDGRKFRLTVFRRRADKVYALIDGDVDFKESPLDCNYLISVASNGHNNPSLKKAQVLE